jgi:hypothetical protein
VQGEARDVPQRNQKAERKVHHVAFPAVNRKGSSVLVQLHCVASLIQRGKPVTPDRRFDEVIRRFRGAEGVHDPPYAFFDTEPRIGHDYHLMGDSFELAIVLVDRMARYGYANVRPIIATGCLPRAVDGAVGRVNDADFERKLDLLLESAPRGALFIFPKENAVESVGHVLARLKVERDVTCMPIENLGEINFLWNSVGIIWWRWFAAAFIALAVIGFTTLYSFIQEPILKPAAVAALGTKSINTAGERGVYHTLFCPPIAAALQKAQFERYECTPSEGTIENIDRVLNNPTNIGFVQLDVYANEATKRSEEFKKLKVIRDDFACEHLWMVTKNPALDTYNSIRSIAARVRFVLPPKESGSTATFRFLQANDPEYLGGVPDNHVVYKNDATAVLDEIGFSTDGAVGFFVQFADPDNDNIKLLMRKNLKIVPVISAEILRIKLNGQEVYGEQTFESDPSIFGKVTEATTACTRVAIITGAPTVFAGEAAERQEQMIRKVSAVPADKLLLQTSRVVTVIRYVTNLAEQVKEMLVHAK